MHADDEYHVFYLTSELFLEHLLVTTIRSIEFRGVTATSRLNRNVLPYPLKLRHMGVTAPEITKNSTVCQATNKENIKVPHY